VNRRVRLAPYISIGVLTLGIGLGIGLGLSEAPVIRPVPRTGEVINAPAGTGSVPTATTTMSAQQCLGDSLALTISPPNPADEPPQLSEGGFTLTNKSSEACELSTTPVFELEGSTGRVIAASAPSHTAVNDVIQPGEVQGANLNWQNWCGAAGPGPITLRIILPNRGGAVSGSYGHVLPTCINPSRPTSFFAHGSGGPGTLFGG
jgi:hypothetical protein